MITRLVVALLVVASGLPCQQSTVVSGGGNALQQAIVAASVGDTLLVQAGTYTAVSIDKALTILCDPGVVLADAARVVHIHNLPAGASVVMRNADVNQLGGGESITIESCAGQVVLDGVVDVSPATFGSTELLANTGMILLRGFQAGNVWHLITVDGCTHAEFVDSADHPSLWVENSEVHISNCVIPSMQNNTAAVTMLSSTVTVNDSTLSGGPLTISFWWSMPGVSLASGELIVTGASSIVGGQNLVNASAVESAAGVVRLSPTSQLVSPGLPTITGAATLSHEPIPSVQAAGVASGQVFSGQVQAEPSSYTAVHFNLPSAPVVLPFGTAWIPLLSLAIDVGIVPASGVRSFALTMPPLPTALPILLQPVSLTTAGQILLGPPTPVLIN